MSYMKGVRQGSEGNTSLLKSYGGGSSGPRQGYATGGSVGLNKDGPALSEGLSAAGTPAKPSLARPGRKVGKKKDAKTNINVIVAPSAPKEGLPPMPPMAGPPGPLPMPPPSAPPPGMPPMRASGGRVGAGATSDADTAIMGKSGRYKVGGRVKKRADGGRSTLSADSVRAAQDERDKADRAGNFRNLSGGLSIASGVLGAAIGKGGRAANFIPAAANAGLAKWNQSVRDEHLAEADRISKGRVKPGEEDHAKGGRVGYKIGKVKKRADGGSTISEDSRREAAEQRSKATRSTVDAGLSGLTSGVGAVGALLPYGRGNKLFRTWNAGVSGMSGKLAHEHLKDRAAQTAEADRIERGQAEPGKEDRKHGGKVCRAEGGSVGGLSNEDGGAGGASGRLEKIKMYGK